MKRGDTPWAWERTPRPAMPRPRVGPHPTRGPRREKRLGLVLALAALVFFTAGLGRIDLWAPDEPRYAAIAEELRSGRHGAPGLVLLHLNDAPYSQKPPLYFWLAAAFGLAPGRVDEVAARLPSALAGVACVLGTFWIARRLRWPAPTAWLAAALLATSFRFAFTARRAQLDVLLCAFELLAIALFVGLELRRGGLEEARQAPARIAALHAALGAAALVKGPVGWLPLLIFAAFLAWEGRLAAFRALVPAWAFALSIGPLLLWISAATAFAPDGFAAEAVGTNVFARFFAGSSHARPFYYFAYQLPVDFLPWSLLLPTTALALVRAARTQPAPRSGPLAAVIATASARPGLRERAIARLLVAWILVPLAFFSLSAGKRGVYLLPIFPALALGCAYVATRTGPAARAGTEDGGVSEEAPDRGRLRRLAGAVAAVAVLELAGFLFVLPRLDAEKSPRPIAQSIARRTRPDEAVALFGLRPLEGAIPYYGDRAVRSIASADEAERFLAEGGQLILMRASELDRLGEALALVAVERFRTGRRALVLARRRGGEAVQPSTP
jgi:4-amino-4-deoxy-L-arabinose transferase-like glycosyltransferase